MKLVKYVKKGLTAGLLLSMVVMGVAGCGSNRKINSII